MNTRFKSILIPILSALVLSGCNSFLAEYSQDERVPSTTKDYQEILFGEAYFKGTGLPFDYVELLTDDVKANFKDSKTGDDTRQQAYGYFTWQDNPEITPTGGLNNDLSWEKLYHQILTSNVVLKKLPDIPGTPEEKSRLEGEIHAIRAYAYFILVNLYADPYTTPEEAAKTPGVPINNHTYGEDTNFPRNSVAEIYTLILDELEAGMTAFERYPASRDIFRWNEAALATLGSRVCLYMKDWDRAEEYARTALSYNSSLWDLTEKDKEDPEHKKMFISNENREINFSFGFYQTKSLSAANIYYFNVSDDLLSLYEPGDLRYNNNNGHFIGSVEVQVGTKLVLGIIEVPVYEYFPAVAKSGPSDDTGVYGQCIRSAEAYLNLAEALAMKGDKSGATEVINQLRKARISGNKATLDVPNTDEQLVQMVRDERRRELCFENQRWFDLRRWGKPELTHEYILDGTTDTRETYTLPQGSPKYTLPIPQEVRLSDPALGDNPQS